MKKVLALFAGCRKYALPMFCIACCVASFEFVWQEWFNFSVERYGVPLYRGSVSQAWIDVKGGMGYPISAAVLVSFMLGFVCLCASSWKDAAKMGLANLVGIVALGFCSMSPVYVEPCTHDAVLISAWIAGLIAAEGSPRMRVLLALCFSVAVLAVGEVWHGIGGATWCPMKEMEPFGAPFWMGCMAMACAASVYARIIVARLGLAGGSRKVWISAFALSAGLCFGVSGLLRAVAPGEWELELAALFGELIPLSCAMLNVLLAAVSWGLRARAKRAAVL